jgi:hypothetical protein
VHGRQLAQALSDEGLTKRIKKRAALAPSAIKEREWNAVNSCLCKKGDFLHWIIHRLGERQRRAAGWILRQKFRRNHGTRILKDSFLQSLGLALSPPPSVCTVINGCLPNLSFDLSSLCLAGRDIAYIIS